MAIRQIELDDYSQGQARPGAVVVAEWVGRVVLTIRTPDGKEARAQVLWDDLERAWRAVQQH